ncbi:DUF2061 domain-containing protein [Zunongwangia sp. F260]|uniref:DUF2061 domain-containing protein n=2 Tax=Autumnicola TaxID=3160927 RepID=A0ABU3CGC3_9FLAO|nr:MULTISPECIES: DUF2061 domain-containing protein [unclassified Zunongwangia]MDT0645408.1 DUF2061 domain-containing protein [Zunongwangia sp. F260]MDT0685063.1 DUF2061 domain-containing protein [Zunongwangia sp. F225]
MLMLLDQTKTKKSYKKDRAAEKPMRSIAKTVSWRIVGTMDTVAISWVLTGEIKTAMAIGSVELVTKMILYFGHERIWNKINFGKE